MKAFLGYIHSLVGSTLGTVAAITGGVVVEWWTAAPEALQKVVIGAGILTLADTLLGTIRAFARPEGYDSAKFGRVLTKALVYMASLLGACGIDYALGFDAGVMFAVALLICFREATSTMENSAALGFPWPEAICKRLSKLQDELDGDNPDE